jgi:peptidyl-prolyl cis-trans isomerase B (cyclophilin B)
MEFILYGETPKHRDNFIKLAGEQYFDSLLFHRVIKDFMIQGGDPDSKYAPAGARLGEGGPDYRLDAEFRTPQLLHKRGALAAAREGDVVNPMKRSSASQFYVVWGKIYTPQEIESMSRRMKEVGLGELSPEQKELYSTVGGTPFLDGQYTVFGEITKGLEVVDKIQNVATDANDRPLEDVRILSVKVIE